MLQKGFVKDAWGTVCYGLRTFAYEDTFKRHHFPAASYALKEEDWANNFSIQCWLCRPFIPSLINTIICHNWKINQPQVWSRSKLSDQYWTEPTTSLQRWKGSSLWSLQNCPSRVRTLIFPARARVFHTMQPYRLI